jgi:hypothetical protein
MTLNEGEIRDLNPTKQLGFNEFWNNKVAFRHRSHMSSVVIDVKCFMCACFQFRLEK